MPQIIHNWDLDNVLREVPLLKQYEREYVEGVFRQYKSGDISQYDIERVVRDLKLNLTDPIDKLKAEKIHKVLNDHLNLPHN